MSDDPVGDYIAALAAESRAQGRDPETYVVARYPDRRRACPRTAEQEADLVLRRAIRRAVNARLGRPRRGPARLAVAAAALTGDVA